MRFTNSGSRATRAVEVASLSTMSGGSFAGPTSANQAGEKPFLARSRSAGSRTSVIAGTSGANALRCEVTGSVGPLIAALADYPVAALTSREPSLEEIFLHHYDTRAGDVGH